MVESNVERSGVEQVREPWFVYVTKSRDAIAAAWLVTTMGGGFAKSSVSVLEPSQATDLSPGDYDVVVCDEVNGAADVMEDLRAKGMKVFGATQAAKIFDELVGISNRRHMWE